MKSQIGLRMLFAERSVYSSQLMTIKTQSNEITPTVPMQPISSTCFLPSHLLSSQPGQGGADRAGILSKLRKLPHCGGLAMFFFNQLVTPCPPVWRWWRWWENILYSSQLVCLLYLYISMWSPLWEHHICSPSAQHYHSSPSSCLCLFALFLSSQQR